MKNRIIILSLCASCLLAIVAFVYNSETKTDPLALSPIVAKRVTTPTGTLVSCNLKALKDTVDIPLSYLTEELQVVKLDNRDEALVGGWIRTTVGEKYILVSNNKQTPYKLFTRAGAEKVLCGPYAENLTQVEGSAETYFVVATRAHSFDVECLTEIYKKRFAYVGMLGSRSRSALVRRQLIEAGTAPEKAEELHAPIGLAIKAQTAQEIALSILAEIVEVKNGRQQTEGFPPELLNALDACTGQGKAPVLVTIVSRHGSTPREVGAKMLVLPDGRSVGSVGGGIMEYRVQQLASKMQAGEAAPCQLAEYSASAKEDDAALAACGGSMNVFLQLLKEEENNEA